jgi:signal peptidase I
MFVVGCVLGIYLFRESVIEGFRIPSESMKPTLIIDDHVLVWKLAFGLNLPFIKEPIIEWLDPQRGDILVFTHQDRTITKKNNSPVYLIKRIIGLPGDMLEIDKNHVFINGSELQEDYAVWKKNGNTLPRYGPISIPETSFFVMGDNRDESQDSRYWKDDPFVKRDEIIGKAFIIYYSKNYFRFGKLIS